MPFVPILGSIAEIVAQSSQGAAGGSAKNVASVFHYRLALLVAPATKTALEAGFQAQVMVPFTNAANVRITQVQNSVRWINDAIDAPVAFARAVAGAIATDSAPGLDTVTMLLRTGNRGKSYRGSKHFAGLNEIDTTGDVLTGAGLTRWQTLQTAVAANIVDALNNVWTPTVVSRKLSQLVLNPTTVVANDVTQVLINKSVGTMRRRRTITVR